MTSSQQIIVSELISFGWGQFDMDEEAKMLDENKLRKDQNAADKMV
jgi:hypothetical protein